MAKMTKRKASTKLTQSDHTDEWTDDKGKTWRRGEYVWVGKAQSPRFPGEQVRAWSKSKTSRHRILHFAEGSDGMTVATLVYDAAGYRMIRSVDASRLGKRRNQPEEDALPPLR